jgi:hypothetical protein
MNADMKLITEAYRKEQAALHATGAYGFAGLYYGPIVGALLNRSGARSILDYGCGSKRSLFQVMRLPEEVIYEGYDPAIPEYASEPLPAELVCCIDVLEHIEPELLDNVLDHLCTLCDPLGLFSIHTHPAKKTLSDGRNAHLTQQGHQWWLPKLKRRFDVLGLISYEEGFVVLVRSHRSDAVVPQAARLKSALGLLPFPRVPSEFDDF